MPAAFGFFFFFFFYLLLQFACNARHCSLSPKSDQIALLHSLGRALCFSVVSFMCNASCMYTYSPSVTVFCVSLHCTALKRAWPLPHESTAMRSQSELFASLAGQWPFIDFFLRCVVCCVERCEAHIG